MAIEVFSDKVECKVSAKRLWHGAFVDAHNCLPKALPHEISSVEYEGSAGFQPGCVRTIHLHKSHAEEVSKEKHPEHVVLYIKEKLVEVDHHNLKLKAELVEGGFLGVLLKHAKYTVHVKEGAHHGTSVVHYSFEYEALSAKNVPEVLKEVVPRGYTGVEAYLLAHDDYAN